MKLGCIEEHFLDFWTQCGTKARIQRVVERCENEVTERDKLAIAQAAISIEANELAHSTGIGDLQRPILHAGVPRKTEYRS